MPFREPPPPSRAFSIVAVLAYLLLLVAGVAGFLLVQRAGGHLTAPAPRPTVPRFGAAGPHGGTDIVFHVLLALLVILAASRLVGGVFKRLHQPPVIGEVLAGIMLGPSLLGRFAPHVAGMVLPPSVAPQLSIIAQVGVILFMFLVGLELDTGLLSRRTHTSIAISHASIVAPFLLGGLLALWLYPRLSSSDVPFTYFALFLGVSMSVTAFPVLARILTDRGMHRSPMGVMALTCAAIDDVTAWCLLAFVVSIVHARSGGALVTVGLTAAYVGFMLVAVRPLAMRVVRAVEARGTLTPGVLTAVFGALLLSALVTEAIGIHALFGAFLLGAIVPHDSRLAREVTGRLEDLVVVLFLPAFFAFTGLRTQIGLLATPTEWGLCGVIVLVACAGKFGGTLAAARATSMSWRDAASLGILMNTRGLMELVVLNIGLDLGVISPKLFAMLVLMAVVTTVLTTPVLQALTRGRQTAEVLEGSSARA